MLKRILPFLVATVICQLAFGAVSLKPYTLNSPNGKIEIKVDVGEKLVWQVKHGNQIVLAPSEISMTLESGEVLGHNVKFAKADYKMVDTSFEATFYKKQTVIERYNEMILKSKDNWGIIVRAYDDGVAYRFFTQRKGELIIVDEMAEFNFNSDITCYIPYVCDLRDNNIYHSAFESLYDVIPVSKFVKDTLAFLPILADVGNGKKVAILESDLEAYPGMFITDGKATNGLQSHFAPYPLEEKVGGFNNLNIMVTRRADYIAKVNGTRSFPWRALVITENDAELANNDMAYRLASPSKVDDIGWVKPGKVAWDWWNNWNITHVDFRAGINTETYKYYIDFASANRVEYIVLDEGWTVTDDNILTISPKVNLEELIAYGKQKNVGIILWATWQGIDKALDQALEKYSAMGAKGFKIDFLDRDDQIIVESVWNIAAKAAKYKMIVDYHGMYKPSGLQRTFPNVLNFEGVRGLENCKWHKYDAPKYDVTAPFIRMLAGPMDYTPGAMRNATQSTYAPVNDNPMSQGTRCHQLAMYVVFEAPIQMMADNPTAYKKEQESTDFIAKVPTVFDQTVALDCKVGEYITIARQKNDVWYIGALSNWDARELTIDLSFLDDGKYEATIFKDGINADRNATDYVRETRMVTRTDILNPKLLNGGGWAARIEKK